MLSTNKILFNFGVSLVLDPNIKPPKKLLLKTNIFGGFKQMWMIHSDGSRLCVGVRSSLTNKITIYIVMVDLQKMYKMYYMDLYGDKLEIF